MERKLFVGDIVRLTTQYLLGNPIGTKGVVYEEYDLGWGPGASIIFENGQYDGFGFDEQFMVEKIGHEAVLGYYKFKNVMQLDRDFDNGLFNDVFKK